MNILLNVFIDFFIIVVFFLIIFFKSFILVMFIKFLFLVCLGFFIEDNIFLLFGVKVLIGVVYFFFFLLVKFFFKSIRVFVNVLGVLIL